MEEEGVLRAFHKSDAAFAAYLKQHPEAANARIPMGTFSYPERSILHYAIVSGRIETVKMLCAAGAKLDDKTLLCGEPCWITTYAVTRDERILELLLEEGAPIDYPATPTWHSSFRRFDLRVRRSRLAAATLLSACFMKRFALPKDVARLLAQTLYAQRRRQREWE